MRSAHGNDKIVLPTLILEVRCLDRKPTVTEAVIPGDRGTRMEGMHCQESAVKMLVHLSRKDALDEGIP